MYLDGGQAGGLGRDGRGEGQAMTGQSEAKGSPHRLSDEERAPETDALLGDLERRLTMDWVGDHHDPRPLL